MKKKLLLLLAILCLSGCTTIYHVRVNGYLDTTGITIAIPANTSFFVLTNKNAGNPILEKEIKSKIEGLLRRRGYRVESYEKADFLLSFDYSISSGKMVTEVNPVYQPGEVETVRTVNSKGRTSISYVEYPGYTTYVPYRYTVYISSLTLNVLDAGTFKNANEKKVFWIGEASNISDNPDIRQAINYLLIACFDHFAENTHRSLMENIPAHDPQLKELSP